MSAAVTFLEVLVWPISLERRTGWETGKAYWLEKDPVGEQHGDVNRSNEPIEVIVVQMRK